MKKEREGCEIFVEIYKNEYLLLIKYILEVWASEFKCVKKRKDNVLSETQFCRREGQK